MAAKRFPRRDLVLEETPAPDHAEAVEPVAEVVAAPVVATVEPPAPPAPAVEVSGLVVVRVRGPGAVVTDSMHLAGDEMVLSLTDAQSLGDAVEIVG